ncbi:MAG: hypothetical protein M3245_06485, partial [Actinomycetota bacterium]|nr:hypothetical protein [Actinomycetota bacterium]
PTRGDVTDPIPRPLWLAVVFVASALLGCDPAVDDPPSDAGGTPPARGTLRVSGGDVAVPYASSNRLVGLATAPTGELAGEVNTSAFGVLAPGVVLNEEGDAIVYSSFDGDGPVLRLRRLQGGEDSVVDENAFSAAWSHDGALAYFRAVERTPEDPAKRAGHVVVRDLEADTTQRWTARRGRFVVVAWAGDRLLAYRRGAETWPDLVVFDGRGRMRVLAEESGLVAVSPDGRMALVTVEPDRSPTVHLLRVEDGARLAALTFPEAPDRPNVGPVTFVAPLGSWVGDVAVAAVTEGIATFRVGPRSVDLEQLLHLDPESFPVGATEPQLDASGRRVSAVVELAVRPQAALPETAVISCDRVSLRCRSTAPLSYAPPPRLVYDPSRP